MRSDIKGPSQASLRIDPGILYLIASCRYPRSMRAIKLSCPECNAALNATEGTRTVTCEYCGTRSHIQQRTRFLQRPEPMPRPDAAEVQLPVALEKRNLGKALAIALGAMVLFGVAPVAVCGLVCGGSIEIFKRLESAEWSGADGAVLRDLNGDGTPDIIGRTRKDNEPEDDIMLAAFDGKTGDRLWESEVLGPRTAVLITPMGVTDRLAVLGTGGPALAAVDLKDGSIRWRARLEEKVKRICAGDAATVRVLTEDERLRPVALADGKAGPAAPADDKACAPMPGDDPAADQPHRLVYAHYNDHKALVAGDAIEGMQADHALHHVASGVTVALGHRSPGTEVPVVARYRWPEPAGQSAGQPAEQPAKERDTLREELQDSLTGGAEPEAAHAAMNALMKRLKRDMIKHRLSQSDAKPKPEVLWKQPVPGVDPFSVAEAEVKPDHADVDGEVLVVAYETKTSDVYRLTAFNVADGKRRWDIELSGDRHLSSVLVSSHHALVSRSSVLQVFDIKTGKKAFTIE